MAKDDKKVVAPAPAPVEPPKAVEPPKPVKAPEAPKAPEPKPEPIPAKPAPRASLQELWGKTDVALIYPPFVVKVKALLKACAARGNDYFITSGTRTWKEQDALYAQGRTKPGQIVTKAQGGQSNHNYGIAVDGCLDKDQTRAGLQPDWDLESYKVWAEEAKKLGLDAGLYWKFTDAPHVQLNLARHGLSLHDLHTAYTRNGLGYAGVWALLDKYNWDCTVQ